MNVRTEVVEFIVIDLSLFLVHSLTPIPLLLIILIIFVAVVHLNATNAAFLAHNTGHNITRPLV